MRLSDASRIEVKPLTMEAERFGVFVSDPPFSSWLNVPCSFATKEAAERVAYVLRQEGKD